VAEEFPVPLQNVGHYLGYDDFRVCFEFVQGRSHRVAQAQTTYENPDIRMVSELLTSEFGQKLFGTMGLAVHELLIIRFYRELIASLIQPKLSPVPGRFCFAEKLPRNHLCSCCMIFA
ncbi:uncharacterized protein METZ01_LOCUS14453, partial [marine metagenome]